MTQESRSSVCRWPWIRGYKACLPGFGVYRWSLRWYIVAAACSIFTRRHAFLSSPRAVRARWLSRS